MIKSPVDKVFCYVCISSNLSVNAIWLELLYMVSIRWLRRHINSDPLYNILAFRAFSQCYSPSSWLFGPCLFLINVCVRVVVVMRVRGFRSHWLYCDCGCGWGCHRDRYPGGGSDCVAVSGSGPALSLTGAPSVTLTPSLCSAPTRSGRSPPGLGSVFRPDAASGSGPGWGLGARLGSAFRSGPVLGPGSVLALSLVLGAGSVRAPGLALGPGSGPVLGPGSVLGPGAVIGPRSVLGSGSVRGPDSVLDPGLTFGPGSVLGPGSVRRPGCSSLGGGGDGGAFLGGLLFLPSVSCALLSRAPAAGGGRDRRGRPVLCGALGARVIDRTVFDRPDTVEILFRIQCYTTRIFFVIGNFFLFSNPPGEYSSNHYCTYQG